MSEYPELFTPINIGSMTLKNRLVMAPMTTDYANPDETPSQRQIDYYVERAKGGVGLIGLEVVTVDPEHRYQQHSLGLYSDDQIEGHKKLVDAIHAHGAKVQPQITHTGPESLAPFYANKQPMGPSVVRTPTTMQVCREITPEELLPVIEMYGDTALRAKKAGYDGIELHSAHSYMMLGSFLSPLRNFRQDEYCGRKLEGRMKLLLEVLANIRSKVGNDFPITLRLSGYEREAGGREINDTQRMAPILVEAGVDCFHISGGVTDGNITQIIAGSEYSNGFNVAAAAAIKQVVDVPVLVVGRNFTPDTANEIISSGKADLVALGRALLADPAFPAKTESGNTKQIRQCNSCEGCMDAMTSLGQGVKCSVNAICGQEGKYITAEKPKTSKNVVVIGGGPGGMETARIAAERGHKVTLIEKENKLGGRFRLASALWEPNKILLNNLIDQVKGQPVEIILGEAASEDKINSLKPDAIVVATGGKMTTPEFTGMSGENVIAGQKLFSILADFSESNDISSLKMGNKVGIIGAGLLGVELAELLARTGRCVHLIESNHRMASEAGKKRRSEQTRRLDNVGVIVNTGIAVEEITEAGINYTVADSNRTLALDTIVVMGSPTADDTIFNQFNSLAEEAYQLGDISGFGLSSKAIEEATDIAYRL